MPRRCSNRPLNLLCLSSRRKLGSCFGVEVSVDLTSEVSLEAATDLSEGAAFCGAAFDVGAGAGSIRMRVTTAMWRALFRRRSPPRLMRCRTVLPEEAGIGLVPARLANAASDLMRPRWDQEVSATAAVTGPMPGWSRSGPAGLWRTRSVIRFVMSLRSVSRATTRLASLMASPRVVAVARSSSRARQAAIMVICVAVSGRRASMPRSRTRSSAVSALIVAVRSVLMWSREASSTFTAARMPLSVRGSRSCDSCSGSTAAAIRRASSVSDLPMPRLPRAFMRGASTTVYPASVAARARRAP